MIKKILPYLFWSYMIALLAGTVIPNWKTSRRLSVEGLTFRLDHWLHFFSYFGLCLIFIFWKYSREDNYKTNKPFLSSMLLFVFAAFTEILQLMVLGRSSNLKDFAANSIGIFFAIAIGYMLRSFFHLILGKKNSGPDENVVCRPLKLEHSRK